MIVRIDGDGTETIVGYKTEVVLPDHRKVDHYVLYDENGEKVEELKDGEKEDWHKND